MQIHLQQFGAKLRVKDGLFQVTVPDATGTNHQIIEQFAAHQVEAILLEKGTSVSADALLLALEHGTDIMVLDHFGLVAGRFWTSRPTSTMAIWRQQLALSGTPQGLKIARDWICAKLRARIAYLQKLRAYRKGEKHDLLKKAEQEIADLLFRIHHHPVRDAAQAAASLRGYEGAAGRHYLAALSGALPGEYQFSGRSAQPAADVFNAFLNYAYGILYPKVEKALLRAGVHPYIGFMHAEDYQRKAMLFDFIEPYRIWADEVVFGLFARKLVSGQHVGTAPNGMGVWLNEDGKRLLKEKMMGFMAARKVEIKGRLFDLEEYLLQRASSFASFLLGNKPDATIDFEAIEAALQIEE